MENSSLSGSGTLVSQVRETIRAAIEHGDYPQGGKLPTEAKLTEKFGVSRTVVREAIAALTNDGLLVPKRGSGVFVLENAAALPTAPASARQNLSSILELLEVRAPLEIEAAGLAAQRRSPSQEENILKRHFEFVQAVKNDQPVQELDFRLHLAIMEAANNPFFHKILESLGADIVPQSQLMSHGDEDIHRQYRTQLCEEHEAIALSISDGDIAQSRDAMKIHLQGSLARHRAMLRVSRAQQG